MNHSLPLPMGICRYLNHDLALFDKLDWAPDKIDPRSKHALRVARYPLCQPVIPRT